MNLWRVPIDEATGKTLGPAEPERLPAREVGGLAVARDGRHLAYVDRQTTYAIDRLTFDAQGRLSGKPEEVYESSQEISDFGLSPEREDVRHSTPAERRRTTSSCWALTGPGCGS